MESIQRWFAKHGLVRTNQGKVLGGVCAGLAKSWGIDAWLLRILFVITVVVIPGSQILVYPILWFAMPDQQRAAQLTGQESGQLYS